MPRLRADNIGVEKGERSGDAYKTAIVVAEYAKNCVKCVSQIKSGRRGGRPDIPSGVTGLFAILDRKITKGYTYHVNWGGMPIHPQNVVFRQERNF